MKLRINHLGYLTQNIEEQLKKFRLLGWEDFLSLEDDTIKVKLCFIKKDNVVIELVQPTSFDLISKDFLIKNLNSIYHTAYESYNFDEDLKYLKDNLNGFVIPKSKNKALAFNNKRIVFLYTDIGLIELIEL